MLQFDINAFDIPASKVPVAINTSGTEWFWLSQLAYDNKIYIADGTILELHSFSTINYPDSLGLACSSQLHNVQLPNYCFQTVPNYPNYRLGALTGSLCDSLTGTNDVNAFQLNLKVFPNPSSTGVFHFQFNDEREQIKDLEITDITGRNVFAIKKNIYEVNISNVSSGIYFYSVMTKEGKMFKGKLIRE